MSFRDWLKPKGPSRPADTRPPNNGTRRKPKPPPPKPKGKGGK